MGDILIPIIFGHLKVNLFNSGRQVANYSYKRLEVQEVPDWIFVKLSFQLEKVAFCYNDERPAPTSGEKNLNENTNIHSCSFAAEQSLHVELLQSNAQS